MVHIINQFKMYSSYTKCSNCKLSKSIKWYNDTVIEPKEGVYESSIDKNYCENFTR